MSTEVVKYIKGSKIYVYNYAKRLDNRFNQNGKK